MKSININVKNKQRRSNNDIEILMNKKQSMEKREKLIKNLKQDYARWNDIYENGCSDPSWEDGINLNLVRAHILINKNTLREICADEELPELYFKEEPPIVDGAYMARKEEILQKAKEYYETCINEDSWKQIEEIAPHLDPNNSEHRKILSSYSRITHLKKSIDNLDYLAMRNHQDPTYEIELLRKKAAEIENLDDVQMSFGLM